VRQIIHAFKYEGRRGLARPLARLMRTRAADLLDGAACVVPVPLHPLRRMRRGFNQAGELARHLGLPVVNAIWRIRPTVTQSGLTARERRRNVRHVFAPSLLLTRDVRLKLVAGRSVLLVDDVRTTGATLDACAEVLKALGASEVRALTAARAASPWR
jgi:ComF family protein